MARERKNIEIFTGIDRLMHPSKIPENKLSYMQNMRFSKGDIGIPISRAGIERYNANQLPGGSFPLLSLYEARFSSGTNRILTNFSNGASSRIKYVDSPYTGAAGNVSGTSANYDYKLRMAMLKDKVYVANIGGGAAANSVYDGTNFLEAGCPPMTCTLITTSAVAGGNLTGDFNYLVTYVYDNNMESGITVGDDGRGGIIASPTLAGEKCKLSSIPLGSARCTARKIYRTKTGGGGTFYFVGTLADNVSTDYTDDLLDTKVGIQKDLADFFTYQKPYMSKYVVTHKGRIIQGHLRENLFNAPPLVNGDLSSNGAGSMDANGTYKYRISKLLGNNNPDLAYYQFVVGKSVELTITLTGGASAARLTIPAAMLADEWYKGLLIERTEGGGSKFFYRFAIYGVTDYTDGTFDDTMGDATLILQDYAYVPNRPENSSDYYPSKISISAVDSLGYAQPDLIETTIDVGESDDQVMTGLWDMEHTLVVFRSGSIYRIDTTGQSTGFWKSTPLVTNIGSDEGLQVKTNDGFVFVKTGLTATDKLLVYEWNLSSAPKVCSRVLQDVVNNLAPTAISVKELVYDPLRDYVTIVCILTISGSPVTYIFEYDMSYRDEQGSGLWYIHTNATDMNLYSALKTRDYGVVFGSGIGYLNYEGTSYQDSLGATPTAAFYTRMLQTKWFEYSDCQVQTRRLGILCEGSAAADITVNLRENNTTNTASTITGGVSNGMKRSEHTNFGAPMERASDSLRVDVSVVGVNTSWKVHSISFDLDKRHFRNMGK